MCKHVRWFAIALVTIILLQAGAGHGAAGSTEPATSGRVPADALEMTGLDPIGATIGSTGDLTAFAGLQSFDLAASPSGDFGYSDLASRLNVSLSGLPNSLPDAALSADAWSDGLSISARVEVIDPMTDTVSIPAIEAGYSLPLESSGVAGLPMVLDGVCPGAAHEQDLDGRIVLLSLGSCAASYQLRAAAEAGAAAVIAHTGSTYSQLFGPAGDIDVPVVRIGSDRAQDIADRLDQGAELQLRVLPNPRPETVEEAADACVQTVMDASAGGAPGASLAVGVGDAIYYARGYGVKSVEDQEPVDENTLFRMGSQVQGMTAALLMRLVESGQVDLDAPVQQYVPEWETAGPESDAAITVHDLLAHTSGISNWNALDGQRDADALTAWLQDAPYYYVWMRPGEHYYFAEANYQLVGLIAERVLGKSFHEILATEILEPAGLDRTMLLPEAALADGNYATGHNGSTAYAPDSYDHWAYHPVQGGFTTPSDLVRWSQLLMDEGGDLLDASSVTRMLDAGIPRPYYSPTETGGYLYLEDELWGEPVHYWMGGVTGWSWSVLMWAPGRQVSVALSGNGSFGDGTAVARCVMQQVAELQREAPVPTRYTDPETWQPHVGTYTLFNVYDFGWTARVDHAGDRLHLDYASLGEIWPSWDLYQYFEDTFKYNGSSSVSFVSDDRESGQTDWFYYRGLIGEHVGDFPGEFEMEGPGCATMQFTSRVEIDPQNIRAFGLRPLFVKEQVPAVQDDPEDPTSASIRYDFELPSEAARFTIHLGTEAGNELHWYLMRDADEDGQFSYPDERWRYYTGTNTYKLSNLADDDLMPAGRYQLWVYGKSVVPNSHFDLSWDAVAGEDLWLENLPEYIGKGDSYTLDVCVDADDLAGQDGPLNGAVVFDYGHAPRVIHVPVTWRPGEAEPTPEPTPEPTEPRSGSEIYLPRLFREQ